MCHYCIKTMKDLIEHQKQIHAKEYNTVTLSLNDDNATKIKYEVKADYTVDRIYYN